MENLADCIRMWMVDYKKNSVKPATYDRLQTSKKLLERYSLAGKTVSEINVDDVQRFINALVQDGYSQTTIKKEYSLLTAFFKFAYSRGLISAPVYIGVELPGEMNVKKRKRSIDIFSHSEQQRLMRELQTMRKPEYAAAILMLEAGLRVGEVLALEWDDILWDQRAVQISKTLVRLSERHGETFVQHSPKSRSSLRTLPLSRIAMESLRRLLNFRELDSPYLFCSEENRHLPISYCALKYRLKDAFRKANVKQKSFHIFRHTFASNCYERGCNVKVLSKMLGHRDASVTYNVYIHLFGNDLEEMRKIID